MKLKKISIPVLVILLIVFFCQSTVLCYSDDGGLMNPSGMAGGGNDTPDNRTGFEKFLDDVGAVSVETVRDQIISNTDDFFDTGGAFGNLYQANTVLESIVPIMDNLNNNNLAAAQASFIKAVGNISAIGGSILVGALIGDGLGIIAAFLVGQLADDLIISLLTEANADYADNGMLDGSITVEKPNIYIYPKEDTFLSVKLEPSYKITSSIPDYKNGWDVFVRKDGTINDSYGYLFYEASVDDVWNMESGWVVRQEELEGFLDGMLDGFGLNKKEKEDFIEYWMLRLPANSEYVLVSPQPRELIDKKIKLVLSEEPDSLLRLWIAFKPLDRPIKVQEYKIEKFNRIGFTVVEWGGFVK